MVRLIGVLKFLRALSLVTVFLFSMTLSSEARADRTREFILSCSYGVLAGTLVGAATLAFSDKPGENLNKVARGASLGLYGGILLGLFVVYGGAGAPDDDIYVKFKEPPRLLVAPVLGDSGLQGAQASYTVLKF